MLIQILNQRIQRCVIQENTPSDQGINTFNDLFIRHDEEEAEKILARKANGSPGEMVRLGKDLFVQHVANHSLDENLHIEDLIALE
jgi:hypothetical protein